MTDEDPFAPLPDLTRRRPSARPLLGLRLLLVEDSRFAAEAVRLMCLKSGARLRRADSLAAAHRHLSAYQPAVTIVDLGLPDGPGESLIAELAAAGGHGILALSGDPEREAAAMDAGAALFLHKPLDGLAVFQQAVMDALPPELKQFGPRALSSERVTPDLLALKDDLAHAVALLDSAEDPAARSYLAQFLHGLATSAGDVQLDRAAARLGQAGQTGVRGPLRHLLTERVAQTDMIA